MKRQPARLPSARQSSSSADVWWISSTTNVSRAVMSPSSNQRRAIPVVTITTFHVGVSVVALRSRFTTPTLSAACRMVVAIDRMARVFPVPVPATIPNPRREAPDVVAVLPGEQGVDIQTHGQLDGLAGRARRGDHHDPPGGGLRGEEGVGIWGKEVVAGNSHGRNID